MATMQKQKPNDQWVVFFSAKDLSYNPLFKFILCFLPTCHESVVQTPARGVWKSNLGKFCLDPGIVIVLWRKLHSETSRPN